MTSPETAGPARVSPDWLALREPADASARAADLAEHVRGLLSAGQRTVIHDLGCGTGSMSRWLAPQLAGEQHWVMYDRDADLLARAAADPPRGANGATVTVTSRQSDITRLGPCELAGASLITASALLDMLTSAELNRLVLTCAGANCPVLLSMSVIGRVDVAPADPVDRRIAEAFNDHQRRFTGEQRLLGPDAVAAARDALLALGTDVLVRPSPWRLGPAHLQLMEEWFTGWVDAAIEQDPELTDVAIGYRRRRLDQAAAGQLGITVFHQDLLAFPRPGNHG